MGNNPSKEKKHVSSPVTPNSSRQHATDDPSTSTSVHSHRSRKPTRLGVIDVDSTGGASSLHSAHGSPVIPISPSLPQQGVSGVSVAGRSSRKEIIEDGNLVYSTTTTTSVRKRGSSEKEKFKSTSNPILGSGGSSTPTSTTTNSSIISTPTPSISKFRVIGPKPLSPLSPLVPTFQRLEDRDLQTVVAPKVPAEFADWDPNEEAEVEADMSAAGQDGDPEQEVENVEVELDGESLIMMEEEQLSNLPPLKSTINSFQPSSSSISKSNPSISSTQMVVGSVPLLADEDETSRLLMDSVPISMGLSLAPLSPPPPSLLRETSTPPTFTISSVPPIVTPLPLSFTIPSTYQSQPEGDNTPTFGLSNLPEETVVAKQVPPLKLEELGRVVVLGGKDGEGLELEAANESAKAIKVATLATQAAQVEEEERSSKNLKEEGEGEEEEDPRISNDSSEISKNNKSFKGKPSNLVDPQSNGKIRKFPIISQPTLQNPIPTSRYPQTAPLLALVDSPATAIPLPTVSSPSQAALIADHTIDLGAGPDGVPTMITWKGSGSESSNRKRKEILKNQEDGDESKNGRGENSNLTSTHSSGSGGNGEGKKVYVTGSFAKGWKTKIELRKNDSKDNFSALVKLPPGPNKLKFIVDSEWKTSPFLPATTDREGNFVNYVNVKRVPALPYVPGMGLAKSGAFAKIPLGQGPQFEQKLVTDDSLWTDSELPNELLRWLEFDKEIEEKFLKGREGEENEIGVEMMMMKDQKMNNPFERVQPPMLPASLKNVSAILNRARKEKEFAEARGIGRTHGLGGGDDSSILPAPYHSVLNHLMLSPQTMRKGFNGLAITTRFRKKYYTTVYYRPYPRSESPPPDVEEMVDVHA